MENICEMVIGLFATATGGLFWLLMKEKDRRIRDQKSHNSQFEELKKILQKKPNGSQA